jgi:hypothetical protein
VISELAATTASSEGQEWARTLVGAVLTGFAGAAIAWATVRWTQRAQLHVNDLQVSRATAGLLVQHAEELRLEGKSALLQESPFRVNDGVKQWDNNVSIRRRALVDADLAARLVRYTDDMRGLVQAVNTATLYSRRRAGRDLRPGDLHYSKWASDACAAVDRLGAWVEASLVAHQAREPLPPRLPDTRWPPLDDYFVEDEGRAADNAFT